MDDFWHCRVGAVKYKGATNLRVLPRPAAPGLSNEAVRDLHESLDRMVEWCRDGGELGAVVIITWDMQGKWNRASRFHNKGAVDEMLAGIYATEILRHDVALTAARGVLNNT